jgi:DnaJ-class molecular chaperone
MINRNEQCKACEGVGMLADDEGWQYRCPICGGEGTQPDEKASAKVMSVDDNNRLLD